jgi:leucyl aminopeptidase (aminopeptidase T)
MTIIAPDVSSRLRPDFVAVVHTIYTEFCNLQRDSHVLILSDARTPDYVVATFQGMAQALGADAARIESTIPFGGPTYQPGVKWSPMLAGAARAADLLVDLGIGYANFVVEAIERGARVIMPGDGIGNPYLEDILIRTIRDVDIHKIRHQADRIAERFSQAKTCRLLTADDCELVIDIAGLSGTAADGFLWDRDKGAFKSNYGILPPAQPGILLPRGRANGTVSVDGTVLWHPIYHEEPRSPLKLRFDQGRLVEIGGDPYLSNRLRAWLDELDDASASEGPNHLNIGINPNALLTQNQEWERVYGSVTCGMGDMSILSELSPSHEARLAWAKSKVHWDWTVNQPSVLLDDEVLLQNGRIF